MPGLADMRRDLPRLLAGAPDAVISHRGPIAQGLLDDSRSAIVLHLSAATAMSGHADVKTLLTGVEDALHLGADAVSVHVSFGVAEETSCSRRPGWSLRAAPSGESRCWSWRTSWARRRAWNRARSRMPLAVSAELGADIVKVPYTGSPESFAAVVSSCFVPIVMAGGSKTPWADVLTDVRDAISAGAHGVCIGRNVFQRADPAAALGELRAAVHGQPAKVLTHA